MHGFGGFAHQFAGVLEGIAPRQGEGQVGKIGGAGSANPRLLHGQDAVDLLDFVNDLPAGLGGNLIHENADRFAGQVRGDAQNHERNHDGGERVGIAQPVDMKVAFLPNWRRVRRAPPG